MHWHEHTAAGAGCLKNTFQKGPGASHGSKQKETQRDPVRAREQLQQPPTLHELTSSCTGTAAPSEDVGDPMWLIDSVHVDPLSQDT